MLICFSFHTPINIAMLAKLCSVDLAIVCVIVLTSILLSISHVTSTGICRQNSQIPFHFVLYQSKQYKL